MRELADRGPKRVFVLGVYVSAVHARGCDTRGRQTVGALAVACMPCIFRCGDGWKILSGIDVRPQAGYRKPPAGNLDGPSPKSSDEHSLRPLELTRADARKHAAIIEQHALSPANRSRLPQRLTDAASRETTQTSQ